MTARRREKMIDRLRKLLAITATRDIGVWGDCMVDEYIEIEEVKVNPEADTPAFKVDPWSRKIYLGGAANTSRQLSHLCNKRILIGRGYNFLKKTRYAKNGHVLMRIDDEKRFQPICPDDDLIEKCHAWVVSDYHKGTVYHDDLFEFSCRAYPVVIDTKILPSVGMNSVLKFNTPDIFRATHSQDLMTACIRAKEKVSCDLVITRGNLSPIICGKETQTKILEIPHLSEIPNPFEPSGAGDAFSAFLALFLSCDCELEEAATFAHIAASAAGSTGIFRSPVLRCEILGMLDPKERKFPGEELEKWIKHRVTGPLVVTNGCFDMIHPGHVHLLNRCRQLGGKVLVLVNTDESVRVIKGSGKPHMDLAGRMEMLAALDSVDAIIPFDGSAAVAIKSIHDMLGRKVDYLVKGADNNETPPGYEYAEKVELVPIYGEHSSDIAKRITSLSLRS